MTLVLLLLFPFEIVVCLKIAIGQHLVPSAVTHNTIVKLHFSTPLLEIFTSLALFSDTVWAYQMKGPPHPYYQPATFGHHLFHFLQAVSIVQIYPPSFVVTTAQAKLQLSPTGFFF